MKAFIFDLDGVIVFTDKFHYQAWKKMADRMGIYFDETINNRLRGVSRAESLEIILEKYEGEPLSAEKKAELMEEKNNTYRELLKTMTAADVTDQVRATLKKLHEAGFKLAIGSSSKNAKFILEKVELLDAFDAISDGNNITHSIIITMNNTIFRIFSTYLKCEQDNLYAVSKLFSNSEMFIFLF